jgi:hypothetical protein
MHEHDASIIAHMFTPESVHGIKQCAFLIIKKGKVSPFLLSLIHSKTDSRSLVPRYQNQYRGTKTLILAELPKTRIFMYIITRKQTSNQYDILQTILSRLMRPPVGMLSFKAVKPPYIGVRLNDSPICANR